MFLCWPSSKIVQAIVIRQKLGRKGRGLFSLYIYTENKSLLVRNHRIDFNLIKQNSFFRDPLARLFKPLWCQKIIAPIGRFFFLYL